MTPVREKVFEGSVTGETGTEAPRSREDAPGSGREREGRRAGILLIIVGCVLMALAAGEASADTAPVGAQDTAVGVRSGPTP